MYTLPGFNPLLPKRDNNHSIAPEPSLRLLHRLQSPPARARRPSALSPSMAPVQWAGLPFPRQWRRSTYGILHLEEDPALVAPYYLPSISSLLPRALLQTQNFSI